MYVNINTFWLPKEGNPIEEYEDAFWYEPQHQRSTDQFVCAIADGASETSFSNIWANLLTQHYCGCQETKKVFFSSLAPIQKVWLQKVNGFTLPWYAEEKLQSGAFSTLTGLTLKRERCSWEVLSVGDSCLFQIRGRQMVTSFPYHNIHQFSSHPTLLCSLPGHNLNREKYAVQKQHGQWRAGDHFFLMTDALALWFLNQLTATAIKKLCQMKNQSEFGKFVRDLRGNRYPNGHPSLRNDDMTFVRITIN